MCQKAKELSDREEDSLKLNVNVAQDSSLVAYSGLA